MSDLPTKPGHYYWRESEGGEWEIAQINRCMDVYFVGCDMHYGLKKTGGEWLPIPTAEELVELQGIKKMVDEGQEVYAVYDDIGALVSIDADSKNDAWHWACNQMEFSQSTLERKNFTCEPVTIIRKEQR